jgi:flagellar basal-body rod protein FlgC
MVSAINSALSGLAAATQRINVSAQNIANADSTQTQNSDGTTANTPYVPQQLVQSSQTSGGVTTSAEPVTPPSVSIYNPSDAAANANGITQYPNVDPAQQLIQAQVASYDAQGNINVLKVESKLYQSVLNIVS